MEPVLQLKLVVGGADAFMLLPSTTTTNTTTRTAGGDNDEFASTTTHSAAAAAAGGGGMMADGNSANSDISSLTALTGLASGTCFDFNALPGHDHLFLVGTEEGKIHKCSKAYAGQYLETYEGHHMGVYAVKWNPFHPRLFLSCSADWTVKLWDHTQPQAPLLTFDLGNSVGDIDWSPVSSTTFAAVTSDGRVSVFDLTANKHEAICVHKVARRAKLTHVAFNGHEDPVLLVGDDRGEVHSLKLSPNLRNLHEPKDEAGNVLPHDVVRLQYNLVEKLLVAAAAAAAAAAGGGGGI
jgi:dynein intermediate chain 1